MSQPSEPSKAVVAAGSDPAGLTTLPIGSGESAWTDGARIGRFSVCRLLGAGGMGVVLEADDPELERRVAIKVMHVGDGSRAEVHRGRLVREARAAARLSHPNIITIHDVGTLADGHPFIAMELVEGQTLEQWQATPRPWRDVVDRYLAAARGLSAAHDAGLVHRDFKPHNVLLGSHGTLRVSDFGIAAVAEQDEPRATGEHVPAQAAASPAGDKPDQAPDTTPDTPLTAAGEVLGTPAYMAPEQRIGAAVDARADQYSFCVALYEALTGVLPFGTEAHDRARRAAVRDFVVGKRRPGPRRLYAIIARGLAPAPADRYPSMREVIAELERTLVRRRLAVAALATGLAASAAIALLTSRDRPGSECEAGAALWAETYPAPLRAALDKALAPSKLAPQVAEELARWGARWTESYRAACRDTRVARIADEDTLARRTACLSSARAVVAGVLGELAAADRVLAARSLEIARNLPALDECRMQPGGLGGAAPAHRTERRSQLDAADTAITLGKLGPAITTVTRVLEQSRKEGDRELEALALLRLGRLQRRSGETALAATTFFDAAVAAEALARHELATEAWAEWLFVRSGRDVDPATLADGARRAHAALLRAGDPPALRALLLTNEGVVAFEQRRYAEADALYREAARLRVELFGQEDPRVADLLDNLSVNLDRWGRTLEEPEQSRRGREALDLSRQVLALREKLFGPSHPAVARSLQNLSGMVAARGDRREARELAKRALAIKTETLGADHVELATTLSQLADFDERDGKLREALAGYQRALVLREKASGASSTHLVFSLTTVAEVSEALGLYAEAAVAYRRLAQVGDKDATRQRAARRALLAEVRAGAPLAPARAELAAILGAESETAPAAHRAEGLAARATLAIAAGALAEAQRALAEARPLADGEPCLLAELEVLETELAAARGQRAAAQAAAARAERHAADESCATAAYLLRRRLAAATGTASQRR